MSQAILIQSLRPALYRGITTIINRRKNYLLQRFTSAQDWIRTSTPKNRRYHLKVVRLPISPPGHCIFQRSANLVLFLKSIWVSGSNSLIFLALFKTNGLILFKLMKGLVYRRPGPFYHFPAVIIEPVKISLPYCTPSGWNIFERIK